MEAAGTDTDTGAPDDTDDPKDIDRSPMLDIKDNTSASFVAGAVVVAVSVGAAEVQAQCQWYQW